MKKFYFIFLLIPFFVKSEITPRVNWPPPSSCGNGCDQTIQYPTSACYQCPSGSVEEVYCQGKGTVSVPGHLCEKQVWK